jgi:hypothetical protein
VRLCSKAVVSVLALRPLGASGMSRAWLAIDTWSVYTDLQGPSWSAVRAADNACI